LSQGSSPESLPSRRTCSRCVLPESPPDIVIGDDGLCSVCRLDALVTAPAGGERTLLETDFVRILLQHKGKHRYDCMVMCSGGKDSTASLWYMVKRYHLNVLAFTFDHGFETEEALANVKNAVERLGVDYLFYRSSYMNDLFAAMIQTRSKAVICHPCSIWYMGLAFDVAARYDIPLIIAGWTKGQSTRQEVMTRCACNIDAPEYQSMGKATKAFLESLKKHPKYKDFPRSMEEVLERAKKKHKAMVLSPHWFFDSHPDEYVALISRELGWKVPVESYPARTTNCALNFLSSYLSLRYYGYTHYHVEASKMIRLGLLDREAALRDLEMDVSPEYLQGIASKLGVTLD
jgi:7-cyano-7-deazaguanine synthase in queuosine biosynthesis